jgi:hypothetical protein
MWAGGWFHGTALFVFWNWFKDLRFADVILHPEDGNKIWHFAMSF